MKVLFKYGGEVHTYLPVSELHELMRVHPDTLRRWVRAGAVQATPPRRGITYLSVLDAAKIRKLTPHERRELGLMLVPEGARAAGRVYFERMQAHTLPPARRRYELWDEYDAITAADMIEQGYTYEEIAVELRRTYAAVTNLISQLRKDGTLPPHEDDMSWLTKTCGLLTSAECAELVAA